MMANPESLLDAVREFRREHQSVWSLVGAFLKLWGHTKHSPKLLFSDLPSQAKV